MGISTSLASSLDGVTFKCIINVGNEMYSGNYQNFIMNKMTKHFHIGASNKYVQQ